MPIGTLTRKIQCQSSASVRTPPSSDADAAAAGGHEAEDAHRLGAVGRLREQGHHQRERNRRRHRAADALDGARGDEHLLVVASAAGQRREREERDADQEQPPVAEEVAEPPAEQQEAAEGEQVGVHDPRERRLREAEVLADRRQRDVHDGRVEHDHQARRGRARRGRASGCVCSWSSGASFRVGSESLDRTADGTHRSPADEFPRRRPSDLAMSTRGRHSRLSPSPVPIARADLPASADASPRCSRPPGRTSRCATSRGAAPTRSPVDALARIQLAAAVGWVAGSAPRRRRRAARPARVRRRCRRLGIEPWRQPEEREQRLGVEEERELGDPPAWRSST